MFKSLTLAIFLAISCGTLPASGNQVQTCDLLASDQIVSAGAAGSRVSYLANPSFRCSDGTEIKADSSVTYESTGLTNLIGNVIFSEEDRKMTSDVADYYSSSGRLEARGAVEVEVLENNDLIAGNKLTMLQKTTELQEDMMTVEGTQAYALISSRNDVAGTGEDDIRINANLLHIIGNRILQAMGNVNVERNSLELFGDSLELLQDGTGTKLFFNAEIYGAKDTSGASTNIKGDSVNILFANNKLEKVRSMGSAETMYDDGSGSVRGSNMEITFEDDELKRISSMGVPVVSRDESTSESQAVAILDEFTITGDSIDLLMEFGQIVNATAFGNAKGTSAADLGDLDDNSPFLLREDWIEGDTVIVLFSEMTPESNSAQEEGDESARLIEQMSAHGGARSFFRRRPVSESNDTAFTAQPPMELNYVRGDDVRIFFSDGEVKEMEVTNAQGSFLQPKVKSDTTSINQNSRPRRNREDG